MAFPPDWFTLPGHAAGVIWVYFPRASRHPASKRKPLLAMETHRGPTRCVLRMRVGGSGVLLHQRSLSAQGPTTGNCDLDLHELGWDLNDKLWGASHAHTARRFWSEELCRLARRLDARNAAKNSRLRQSSRQAKVPLHQDRDHPMGLFQIGMTWVMRSGPIQVRLRQSCET